MNSRITDITKGLIALAIMLMFTVSFIASQARANLPAEVSALDDETHTAGMSIILDAETLQKFESLPHLVDTFLALPIDVDSVVTDLSVRSDTADAARSDESPVQ